VRGPGARLLPAAAVLAAALGMGAGWPGAARADLVLSPGSPGAPIHDDPLRVHVAVHRLEWQARKGADDGLLLDARGWMGRDRNKLGVRLEGATAGGEVGDAEARLLYGRMLSTFWDLTAGLRHAFKPGPARTGAVLGVTGLAPQRFEMDLDGFVSERGELAARLEAERDLRFTQRVAALPRLELNAAGPGAEERGVGAGVGSVALGLRLRYEVRRELAPYLGVTWTRLTGRTAGLARDAGERVTETAWVAGVRAWY
jgi:copper resistance protein B